MTGLARKPSPWHRVRSLASLGGIACDTACRRSLGIRTEDVILEPKRACILFRWESQVYPVYVPS